MKKKHSFFVGDAIEAGFKSLARYWHVLFLVFSSVTTIVMTFNIVGIKVSWLLFFGEVTNIYSFMSAMLISFKDSIAEVFKLGSVPTLAMVLVLFGMLILLISLVLLLHAFYVFLVFTLYDRHEITLQDFSVLKSFVPNILIIGFAHLIISLISGFVTLWTWSLLLAVFLKFYIYAIFDRRAMWLDSFSYSMELVEKNFIEIFLVHSFYAVVHTLSFSGINTIDHKESKVLLSLVVYFLYFFLSNFSDMYIYRKCSDMYEKKNVTHSLGVKQEAPQIKEAQEVASEEQSVEVKEKKPVKNTTEVKVENVEATENIEVSEDKE